MLRLLLAVLVLVSWSAAAEAQPNVLDLRVEYTADSVIGQGDKAVPGRLWRTAQALRHESEQGGKTQVVIARLDRNVGWLLLPDFKLAVEMSLESLNLPVDILRGGGGVKQTVVARETVNGLKTTKVRVERNAGPGARFDGFAWVTGDGVIARLQGMGESKGKRGAVDMNFRNVRIARQDPRLFELPGDYRRVRLEGMDLQALIESLEAMRGLGGRARPAN